MVYKTQIPAWLERFLKTQFDEQCHCGAKHSMVYCNDCMGEAFCDKCEDLKHKHHETVRVYKNSRKIGTRVSVIKDFWDISEIQTYVNNRHDTVYLTSRKEAGVNQTKAYDTAHKCQICGWEIKSESRYCSIACKVESKIGQVPPLDQEQLEVANGDNGDLHDQELPEGANGDNNGFLNQEQLEGANRYYRWPIESFRTCSRKGIPRRSPFF